MPKSMTGFGRGVADAPFGRLIAEIQSVNRKHFETAIYLPKELSRFESEVRRWVAEKVQRGSLSIRVQFIPSQEMLVNFLPDVSVLKSVKNGLESLSEKLGLDPAKIDLPLIFSSLPPMQKTDLLPDKDIGVLQRCIEEALDQLNKMKVQEGQALTMDVKIRLETIQKMVALIDELSPEATERMRQKLLEKMRSILPQSDSLDERIVREIALYAEKVDIAEELTRLRSHFMQFGECFKEKGSVGRKMEFVIQEMSREINTIGSKCCEAKISYLVVEIKSEMEKIREQIQNIE
jgi:uncharacterized protein (TIGR00255 family)